MKREKQNQGITLIALIITIIIMLILAGVTIAISINGGLFGQANDAVKLQDIANAEETLQISLVGMQMGKINVSGGITSQDVTDAVTEANVLEEGYNIAENTEDYIITGKTKKGNDINEITVSKTGLGVSIANSGGNGGEGDGTGGGDNGSGGSGNTGGSNEEILALLNQMSAQITSLQADINALEAGQTTTNTSITNLNTVVNNIQTAVNEAGGNGQLGNLQIRYGLTASGTTNFTTPFPNKCVFLWVEASSYTTADESRYGFFYNRARRYLPRYWLLNV